MKNQTHCGEKCHQYCTHVESRLCITGGKRCVACTDGVGNLHLRAKPGNGGKALCEPKIHAGGADSRHGIRTAVFYLVETFWKGRGFLTGHISPRPLRLDLPDEWTDPATGEARKGGAFALLKEAEKRSAVYMTAALQYWMGHLTETELSTLLGSMDYTTGTPTDRSTMPAVNGPVPNTETKENAT